MEAGGAGREVDEACGPRARFGRRAFDARFGWMRSACSWRVGAWAGGWVDGWMRRGGVGGLGEQTDGPVLQSSSACGSAPRASLATPHLFTLPRESQSVSRSVRPRGSPTRGESTHRIRRTARAEKGARRGRRARRGGGGFEGGALRRQAVRLGRTTRNPHPRTEGCSARADARLASRRGKLAATVRSAGLCPPPARGAVPIVRPEPRACGGGVTSGAPRLPGSLAGDGRESTATAANGVGARRTRPDRSASPPERFKSRPSRPDPVPCASLPPHLPPQCPATRGATRRGVAPPRRLSRSSASIGRILSAL